MDPSFPSQTVWQMADLYGPIFKLKLAEDFVVVSSQEYDRFKKLLSGALIELRSLIGDGLFTTNEIDVADDLTRLALDTIGLYAFSFRFNEFYTRVLLASGKRAFRPRLVNQVLTWSENER
ncbi:cytochrome P450 [Penicillium freii]|nr:cytochrome P450 [Penicillium freii]